MAAASAAADGTKLNGSMMQLQLTELPDGTQSSMLMDEIHVRPPAWIYIAKIARQCSYDTLPKAGSVDMDGVNDVSWR